MMRGFYFLVLILSLVSCTTAQTESKPQVSQSPEEAMIERNREVLRQERENIETFIEKNDFVMQKTGSGLYYMTIKEAPTSAYKIAVGDNIEYAYRISLLDGTPIKNSNDDGNRDIFVGKDQVEIGLHEAFLMMSLGERKLFIFPAHLAHGLAGNTDNVPPGSTLIYELEPLKKLN